MKTASTLSTASILLSALCISWTAVTLVRTAAFSETVPPSFRRQNHRIIPSASAAAGPNTATARVRPSTTALSYFEDQESGVARGNPSDQPSESEELHKALKTRCDEIEKRIGLRYLVCARDKGNVNVYKDPKSSPYSSQNVVGAIKHGKIVKSIGEPIGNWIHHEDGWSLAQFEGFENLVLIEE